MTDRSLWNAVVTFGVGWCWCHGTSTGSTGRGARIWLSLFLLIPSTCACLNDVSLCLHISNINLKPARPLSGPHAPLSLGLHSSTSFAGLLWKDFQSEHHGYTSDCWNQLLNIFQQTQPAMLFPYILDITFAILYSLCNCFLSCRLYWSDSNQCDQTTLIDQSMQLIELHNFLEDMIFAILHSLCNCFLSCSLQWSDFNHHDQTTIIIQSMKLNFELHNLLDHLPSIDYTAAAKEPCCCAITVWCRIVQ